MKIWRRGVALLIALAMLAGLGLAEDAPQEAQEPAQVEEAIEAAAEEPAEAPVEIPAEDAAGEPAEQPAEVPEDAPVVDLADAPVEEPDEPGDAPAEEPGEAEEWPMMLEQMDAMEPEDELPEFEVDDYGILLSYNGPGGDVVVPDYVTSIESDAFYDADTENVISITSLTFTGDLDVISKEAFFDCKTLRSVTFDGSVGEIGESAFEDCTSLSSVEFGGDVSTIGIGAFSECPSLSSVKFGGDVEWIDGYAFADCFSLVTLTIPGSDLTVGNCAFTNCASLKSVTFPRKMTLGLDKYGDCSAIFSGCTSLESFQWPEGVDTIPNEMFENCASLKEFTIPAWVTSIGVEAFKSSGLTKLHIPGTVQRIDWDAFENCRSLKSIEIEEGLVSLAAGAFDHVPAATILLPESLERIDWYEQDEMEYPYAFEGCGAMMIVVPGSHAAEYCAENNVPYKYSDGTAVPERLDYPCKLDVYAGQKLKKVAKSNTRGDEFTYESSNPELVKVDPKGNITVKRDLEYLENEEVVITVTGSESGLTAKCNVYLHEDRESVWMKASKCDKLAPGEDYFLEAEYSWGYLSDLSISLSKEGIVAVVPEYTWMDEEDEEEEYTGYAIHAIKSGTTTLTAKSPSGKKASCKITVKKAPSKITLSKSRLTVLEGQKINLTYKLSKGSASTVYWSSSDLEVVDPNYYSDYADDEGIYAVGPGTAVLTATTRNGKSASCTVKVTPGPEEMTVPDTLLLGKGEKYTIKPKITEGTKTTFEYYSDDDEIAKVDKKGKITAKDIGEAGIEVYTCNGLEGYIEVSVMAAPKSVKVEDDSGTLRTKFTEKLSVGETYSFTPVLSEDSGSQLTVKSSKKSVATVEPDPDEPGSYLITARKKGTAKITIQTYNKKKATITVKVSK